MKTTVSEMENALDGTKGSLDLVGEMPSKFESTAIQNIHNKYNQPGFYCLPDKDKFCVAFSQAF